MHVYTVYKLVILIYRATNCCQGEIRLVGGSALYEGRVELCLSGQWYTFCDDYLRSTEAGVVCAQLGYPRESK